MVAYRYEERNVGYDTEPALSSTSLYPGTSVNKDHSLNIKEDLAEVDANRFE